MSFNFMKQIMILIFFKFSFKHIHERNQSFDVIKNVFVYKFGDNRFYISRVGLRLF